jgi:hypothetical protein
MRAVLLAACGCLLLGQGRPQSYEVLTNALGLSDSQMKASVVLTAAQRSKLAEIAKVFERARLASEAMQLGLITEDQWPRGTLCFYPIEGVDLGLNTAQRVAFGRLQAESRPKRPLRELALTILDEGQRKKLADFETALEVVREAVDLRLMARPSLGEVLCR